MAAKNFQKRVQIKHHRAKNPVKKAAPVPPQVQKRLKKRKAILPHISHTVGIPAHQVVHNPLRLNPQTQEGMYLSIAFPALMEPHRTVHRNKPSALITQNAQQAGNIPALHPTTVAVPTRHHINGMAAHPVIIHPEPPTARHIEDIQAIGHPTQDLTPNPNILNLQGPKVIAVHPLPEAPADPYPPKAIVDPHRPRPAVDPHPGPHRDQAVLEEKGNKKKDK